MSVGYPGRVGFLQAQKPGFGLGPQPPDPLFGTVLSQVGVVRIVPDGLFDREGFEQALALEFTTGKLDKKRAAFPGADQQIDFGYQIWRNLDESSKSSHNVRGVALPGNCERNHQCNFIVAHLEFRRVTEWTGGARVGLWKISRRFAPVYPSCSPTPSPVEGKG